MKLLQFGLALLLGACLTTASQAAYLIEIDTDGMDDGVITYNPDFSFGGDTTTASQSSPSSAFGLHGADSIFGGDGNLEPDTYVYTYDPSTQADNLVVPTYTQLGEGNVGTGIVGGGVGRYAVYATWPFTSNVSGGLTTYEGVTSGDSFSTVLNQNDVNLIAPVPTGRGSVWVLLGEVLYSSGDIVVTQTSTSNSFVSMRAAGLLFQRIPEPSSVALIALLGLAAIPVRRSR